MKTHRNKIRFLLTQRLDKALFLHICRTTQFSDRERPFVDILQKLVEKDLEINCFNFMKESRSTTLTCAFMAVCNDMDFEKHNFLRYRPGILKAIERRNGNES